MLRRRRKRKKLQVQRQGGKGNDGAPGRPGGHQAPGGLPNGRGAGATTATETGTGPALTGNWRGSVTARERRGRAGTGIGTEETGRDGGPEVQTGTKTGESVEGAAAAAGTERANVETKKEMAGMTGAGGRSENTTKIEALRVRGPGIKRAGERPMTGGIKTTGTGTETRGKPKGRVGVEAGRGGTKVEGRRRAGKESAATAGIESARGTESSALTSVVVAKRGATISESPATTTVNIVNADGVRALSKCRRAAILLLLLLCFSSLFSTSHYGLFLC